MKFTISRQNTLGTLNRVVGAVAKRNTMSVLSHVLVIFSLRGAVIFTATDQEIFATAECDAEVPSAGREICVPAQKLKDALSAITVGVVEIEIDELKMIIEGDGVRYQFACLPAEEFPAVPAHDTSAMITFEPRTLPRFINACSHAVGVDAANHVLGGIHFCYEKDKDQLTAVALDGHRLSICGIKGLPDAQLLTTPLNLPLKTCHILSGVAGTIEFSVHDNRLAHFVSPRSGISSAILDGDYPDFRHVLPTDYPGLVTIDRKKLLEALTACGIVSDAGTKSVTIITDEAGQLTVSALGSLGSATATIPCAGHETLMTTVPSKQLLQALKSLDGDEVFIKYKDERSPLLLYPSDYGHWDERAELIMAMKTAS